MSNSESTLTIRKRKDAAAPHGGMHSLPSTTWTQKRRLIQGKFVNLSPYTRVNWKWEGIGVEPLVFELSTQTQIATLHGRPTIEDILNAQIEKGVDLAGVSRLRATASQSLPHLPRWGRTPALSSEECRLPTRTP